MATGQWGLMVGSIFECVLKDLRREAIRDPGLHWDQLANAVEEVTRIRVQKWLSHRFPFGSEMPWDNTGHEEILSWMHYFGFRHEADSTARAVTAYTTVQPHWAYGGCSRRWWDFFINGKTQFGNERVLHHYASGLNAIALLRHYQSFPANHKYLLRAGLAGAMGILTNINSDGSTSMGWHGDAKRLYRDAYSADWGIGFYGHWKSSAAYLTCHAEVGWECFYCHVIKVQNFKEKPPKAPRYPVGCRGAVEVIPEDAFRRRLYIDVVPLMISVEGGIIHRATVGPSAGVIELSFQPLPDAGGTRKDDVYMFLESPTFNHGTPISCAVVACGQGAAYSITERQSCRQGLFSLGNETIFIVDVFCRVQLTPL